MQNFEARFQEFLNEVKTRFDQQNASLAEYEKFFARAQELFPAYESFVHLVADGLQNIALAPAMDAKDADEALKAQISQFAEKEKILKEEFVYKEKTLRDQLARAEATMQELREQVAASTMIEDSPRTRAPSKKAHSPKIEAAISKSSPKKILIVDDAEINRVLMGHFFKNMPMELEFAGSGEQAVEKASQQPFDLILMDLQMKGMSGVDAIRTIRSAGAKSQIIAISNQAPTDQERNEVMNSGANEYLTKSLPRDEIRERVFESLFNKMSA